MSLSFPIKLDCEFDWILVCVVQDPSYLYDKSNETAGVFVPAQILYDAFHGRYHSSTGAILLLFIIWGSFFFGGLSITTSAARVVSFPSTLFLAALLNYIYLHMIWLCLILRSGVCPIARSRNPFLIHLAKSALQTQSTCKRSVALRSYMHSSWTPHTAREYSFHCHNIHLYNRMGRGLCSSNFCPHRDGRARF